MNKKEQQLIAEIVSDYIEYQRKSDDTEGIIHLGDGAGLDLTPNSGNLRTEPLAKKVDRFNRVTEEIFSQELIARELMWEITVCERICVYIWPSIKNQIKPGTGDRYRKADVVPTLRRLGIPIDQDRYDLFRELGEAGLLLAHKRMFPSYWRNTG